MPVSLTTKTTGKGTKQLVVPAGQSVTVQLNGVTDNDLTITAPAGTTLVVDVVVSARNQ